MHILARCRKGHLHQAIVLLDLVFVSVHKDFLLLLFRLIVLQLVADFNPVK